jgi:hypothetical protein
MPELGTSLAWHQNNFSKNNFKSTYKFARFTSFPSSDGKDPDNLLPPKALEI